MEEPLANLKQRHFSVASDHWLFFRPLINLDELIDDIPQEEWRSYRLLPLVGPVDDKKVRNSVDPNRGEIDHSKAMYSQALQKVTTILRLIHKVTKILRNFGCDKNNDCKNS